MARNIQCWPSLFRDAAMFYRSCIVDTQGDHYWKDGRLVTDYVYPEQISLEVARRMLYRDCAIFISVHPSTLKDFPAPIDLIPDDITDDWIEFIDHQLFMDSRITPEFYATLAEAYCIMQYQMRDNPNAPMKRYVDEWTTYWNRIESYRARLRIIRRTRAEGQIPPETYQGMYI